MTRVHLVLLAASLASGGVASTPAQLPQSRSTTMEVTAFANAFDRAQLSKDRAALEQMVAADLIFIDGSGQRLGKKEFMDGWTSPGDVYDPVKLVDRVVVQLGRDAAIVGAEATLSGTSEGKKFSNRFRFSDTFKRTNGRWQAVHIQVTRLAEKGAAAP